MLRPDYAQAKGALLKLALMHLGSRKGITITDFCCGTGGSTKMLAGRLPIGKAILIDHNKDFVCLSSHER